MGWAPIALIGGPILAALMIPVFRWMFEEPARLVGALLLCVGAWWWFSHHTTEAAPSPTPTRAARR